MTYLSDITRRFSDKNILVVGDAILDVYLQGATERLCREAPVPVLTLENRTYSCGGAANTAVNLAKLGARVSLLTVIGGDENGKTLLEMLGNEGVSTEHVLVDNTRATVSKTRLAASTSILLRIDEGADTPIDGPTQLRVSASLHHATGSHDALVISDYECGFLSEKLIASLIGRTHRFPVILDARKPGKYREVRPFAVKPNYEEAIGLLGMSPVRGENRVRQIVEAAEELLGASGARLAYVTLDSDGVVLLEKHKPAFHLPCKAVNEVRTIGAGDSFTSALTLALCTGASSREAACIGSAAASVALAKDGTSPCSAAELRAVLSGNAKWLGDVERLEQKTRELRRERKRVVFTNGCFDVLHRGHVDFLRHARSLGDVLIVALNSDEGIRRIKGEGRPINTLSDRIEVLSSLEQIDYLVEFDSDTAESLIELVQPDVYVKGRGHEAGQVPEARVVEKMGGTVIIAPADGLSTSQLIRRIQQGGGGRVPMNSILKHHERSH